MCLILAIANQKGGVGKTATAVNLGASLAALERRTLVVDVDPQGNASSGLLPDEVRESARASLYDVLFGGVPITAAIVRSPDLGYLDVVPNTQDLIGAEIQMAELPSRERRLAAALSEVQHLYDFILLDCPPSVGLFTLNALVAADRVIIPVQAEFYALEGLSQIVETIDAVRQLNPRLDIEGALITMFDGRLTLARQVAEEVRACFGDRMFRTFIPRNVRVAEATSFSRPLVAYDITSTGATSYLALARELTSRRRLAVVA